MANRRGASTVGRPRQSGTAETGGSGTIEILGNADFLSMDLREVDGPHRYIRLTGTVQSR